MAVFAVKSSGISPLEEKVEIDKNRADEKSVQRLCGKNLERVLGVRWLEDEFKFESGRSGSRADCVGLGEKNHPVIIEYKWWESESAVTQIIDYAHKLRTIKKKEFENLVEKKLGTNARERVNWSKIRLVCVARKFKAADVLVAERFNQSLDGRGKGPYQIELIKYTAYENYKRSKKLLEFEEVGLSRLEKEWGLELSLERHKEIAREEEPEISKAFKELIELINSKDQIEQGVLEKPHELTFRRQKDNKDFATVAMREPQNDGTRKVEIYVWFEPPPNGMRGRHISSENEEPAYFLEKVRKHLERLLRKIGN